MAPPTLLSMAQRNLIRNLSSLQDVGDTPYEAVKPALRKIVDPQQLRNIETASPHIADADAELWVAFIKRDVPDWKKKMVEPKNPRSWWKVYRKLYREEKAAQEAQQKQLEEALMGKQKEKEANQTHILSTVVQQKFGRKHFLDGNVNSGAGSYGHERVGTVANAKKSGKNVISAIRKAATKPSPFKAPVSNTAGTEATQSKMWQAPIIPPGAWRRKDGNLMRGPPSAAHVAMNAALDRALKADEKIRGERPKRTSNSPPPLTAANLAAQARSPPRPQPTMSASKAPGDAAKAYPSPAATSIARTASPAATVRTAASSLGPGAGTKRTMSPANPAPPQKRPRPQTSIFMPKRVKR